MSGSDRPHCFYGTLGFLTELVRLPHLNIPMQASQSWCLQPSAHACHLHPSLITAAHIAAVAALSFNMSSASVEVCVPMCSFDRDGDGFITADELKMKLGSQADVSQLIAAADKNGDGKIDYQEFCELVRNA